MEYLLKEDLILINRLTIKRHGGNFVPPFNFLKEEALDYLIEAAQAELFNKPVYPEIHEKAGLYLYNIVSNHPFQDGNKRTGLEAALLFLKLNNYKLKDELIQVTIGERKIPKSGSTTNEVLYHFVIEIASGELDLEEVQLWLKFNIEAD